MSVYAGSDLDRAEVDVRCPEFVPGAYLVWASWWHRVESHLFELAQDDTTVDLEVRERVDLWDVLLDELSREVLHAMASEEPSELHPVVRSSRQDARDAARVARSRVAWLHHCDLLMLRPDPEVLAVMDGLIGALDAVSDDPSLV